MCFATTLWEYIAFYKVNYSFSDETLRLLKRLPSREDKAVTTVKTTDQCQWTDFQTEAMSLTWRGRRYVSDFFHHCPSLTACSMALVVVVVLDRTFMVVAVVHCRRSAELLPGTLPSSYVSREKGKSQNVCRRKNRAWWRDYLKLSDRKINWKIHRCWQ